ncbi:MAG TPA: hypothetical protein VM163_12095 [bacterium]|nr:hypothetical protein [bacterium]
MEQLTPGFWELRHWLGRASRECEGAIVGGAIGDAITDGFAGLFEGKVAESLRKRQIEETRTALSSSMDKMSGCLFGVGLVLTIAWTLLRIRTRLN